MPFRKSPAIRRSRPRLSQAPGWAGARASARCAAASAASGRSSSACRVATAIQASALPGSRSAPASKAASAASRSPGRAGAAPPPASRRRLPVRRPAPGGGGRTRQAGGGRKRPLLECVHRSTKQIPTVHGGDKQPIHIVADLAQAAAPVPRRSPSGRPRPAPRSRVAHRHPSRRLPGSPRGLKTVERLRRQLPGGGTLVIVGPGQAFSPWIERSRAARLIVWSDSADGEALFRLLGVLRASRLPEAELALSCRQLSENPRCRGPPRPAPAGRPPVPARRANPYPGLPRSASNRPIGRAINPGVWPGSTSSHRPFPGCSCRRNGPASPLAPAEEAFAAGWRAPTFCDAGPRPGRWPAVSSPVPGDGRGLCRGRLGEGLDEWISDGETGLLARDGANLYEQAVDLARHPERCRRFTRPPAAGPKPSAAGRSRPPWRPGCRPPLLAFEGRGAAHLFPPVGSKQSGRSGRHGTRSGRRRSR